jgi:addiction module HigA family antidote
MAFEPIENYGVIGNMQSIALVGMNGSIDFLYYPDFDSPTVFAAQEAEMPMKNPPHPGDLIRTEVIEALGLSVSKAAEILKVRRATLSDLLHGKAALTPEMALRIEKAFGPNMDHLLRMQLAYDAARTREHARGISIKRYAPA